MGRPLYVSKTASATGAILEEHTSAKQMARELLPLLRSESLEENSETLKQLVVPSQEQLELIRRQIGPSVAERVRNRRADILSELNALLERRKHEV